MTRPDAATYTTSELERLTTLTRYTAKPGEFITLNPRGDWHYRFGAALRIDGALVNSAGDVQTDYTLGYAACLRRRVTSFTDRTELDPPQAVMEAELARRRLAASFAVGDRVRVQNTYDSTVRNVSSTGRFVNVYVPDGGGNYSTCDPATLTKLPALRFKRGDVVVPCGGRFTQHLAVIRDDVPQAQSWVNLDWDKRVPDGPSVNGDRDCGVFRLATPADVAAFEARIPQAAPAFKVGDLATVTVKSSPFDGKTWPVAIAELNGAVTVDTGVMGKIFYPACCVRPATDAEIAAYHRAHCVKQPEPAKPAPISNATHAGRRVRDSRYGDRYVGIVVADGTARRLNPDRGRDTLVVLLDDGTATWATAEHWVLA